MLTKFVNDVALQMYVKLSDVFLVEAEKIGCFDAHLLHLKSDGHMVSVLVYCSEFEDVQQGMPCEPLELRVMSAISRLKMMLEP